MKFFFTTLLFSLFLQGSHAVEADNEGKNGNLRASSQEHRELALRNIRAWEPRIVGGQNAAFGEYPFFVQGAECGASLIWKDIVLTAAHCKGVIANPSGQVLVGAHKVDTKVSIGCK